MRASSLQVKVALAIVLPLLFVAGVALVFAEPIATVAAAALAASVAVALVLRPLRRESGVLAEALLQSSKAVADARRAQEEQARELRLAAEDFEVAVGALARSVGEADTGPEIARRLAEAALLVTPAAAVAVFQGETLVELRLARADSAASPDEHAVRALLGSDSDAFRWHTMPSADDDVRVAFLPRSGGAFYDTDEPAGSSYRRTRSVGEPAFAENDGRKIDILLSQAALAFHRARSMDRLRRAHDELDDLVRQKQVFLDILSHDLKNPIAVARGRAEMIALKHPEAAEKARPIEQALDRATKIIEEAVLFSKLEREKQLDRPVTDVAALAAEAVHSLAPLAATRGIEVVCSAPAQAPWRANHLIVRAIENLLSNAIKWSPERSAVVVDVEPLAAACRIRVIDHGPGIPPEDRPRLFARFERADRSGVKGVGLGLAIAKRVVDMHGGHIAIEDTPGGGTTFVIELPAAHRHDSPSTAVAREGPA